MTDLMKSLHESIAKLEESLPKEISEDVFKTFEDEIENDNVKAILREVFISNNVNELSKDNILKSIKDLLKYDISKNEQKKIDTLFKEFAQGHYYHIDYGFMVFMYINSLYKEINTKRDGYVYVCKSDIGLHKIGFSKKPKERMSSLGLGSSIKHEAIYVISTDDMVKLESNLHKQFSSKRKHSEWFDLDSEDLKTIKSNHPMGFSPKWTKG